MAIPFIVGGIVVIGGGAKVIDVHDTMERAKEINREAQRIANNATKKHDNTLKSTNATLTELGKMEISIMAGNMRRFADNYSRIRNVRRLRDIPGMEQLRNFNQDFGEIKKASFHASDLATGLSGGMAVGAATAASVYSAVGALGAASTGTAISALSGAAATNATLAWLGGGSLAAGGGGIAAGTLVLGGLVALPALAITALVLGSKADKVLSEAKSQRDEANLFKQKVNNLCTAMEAVSTRANQIKILLENLDDKFYRAVNGMINIIENRGTNWNNYSIDEQNFITVAASLAKTIKIIAGTAIINKDGKLRDNETQTALVSGQKMLNAIN